MIKNLSAVGRRHKWLIGQMRQGIDQALQGAGSDAVSFMRQSPGFNSHGSGPGTVLGSVKRKVLRLRSGAKLIVSSTSKLAFWMEHGTRPHFIRPKMGEFLRFFWPKVGHVVFARLVLHPGTRPYTFMSRGMTKVGHKLQGDLHARFRFLFKRF